MIVRYIYMEKPRTTALTSMFSFLIGLLLSMAYDRWVSNPGFWTGSFIGVAGYYIFLIWGSHQLKRRDMIRELQKRKEDNERE